MSEENVAIVRRGYEHFRATGEMSEAILAPEFVWDVSTFGGWPEDQVYEGADGARRFIRDWTEAWSDWTLDVIALHDAGDKVVAIARQRGRSKATGLDAEMTFAQVWTLRDGKQARMQMYADAGEGMRAAGLDQRVAIDQPTEAERT